MGSFPFCYFFLGGEVGGKKDTDPVSPSQMTSKDRFFHFPMCARLRFPEINLKFAQNTELK